MSADDEPNTLAVRRAHLATLADKLGKTVEQLQDEGLRDEQRKAKRRAAGITPLMIELNRRGGNGRRHDDYLENQEN